MNIVCFFWFWGDGGRCIVDVGAVVGDVECQFLLNGMVFGVDRLVLFGSICNGWFNLFSAPS